MTYKTKLKAHLTKARLDYISEHNKAPNVCYVSGRQIGYLGEEYIYKGMYILQDKNTFGHDANADYIHGYTATPEELGFPIINNKNFI